VEVILWINRGVQHDFFKEDLLMTTSNKPCIHCGKECEILHMQLGDLFTLTFLRVCGPECMFLIAYDFLHEIGEHKSFSNYLHEKENEEDATECKEYIDMITPKALDNMRKDLEANPNLSVAPVQPLIIDMFSKSPSIPQSGNTMRFTRPSTEDKIKWQTQYVEKIRNQLLEAEKDLQNLVKIINQNQNTKEIL
jgi:hypothetical protein